MAIDPRETRRLPNVELDPEISNKIDRMTEESDRDAREVRVSFRWRQAHLDTIERATELFGIPHQSY
jgi:hypothetical protein